MFQRVGEGTDIVAKEMYDFKDKGGRRMALRPEGTARGAGVRRAPTRRAVEGLVRGRCSATSARRGRYRQHHRSGVESRLTEPTWTPSDRAAISSCRRSASGHRGSSVHINGLGRRRSAPGRAPRVASPRAARGSSEDTAEGRRIRSGSSTPSPRDSRGVGRRAAADRPPRRRRPPHTGKACGRAFDSPHRLRGRALVRGLDYYTHTLFEFRHGARERQAPPGAAATTASSSTRRSARRASASASASSGSSSPCEAEGVPTGQDPPPRRFVIDTTGGEVATTLVPHPPGSRRGH